MKSYSREDSEDGLLSFENISGALQERTGHKVWGGSTLIYSTMAARGEGSADHLLGRGCQSILLSTLEKLNRAIKTLWLKAFVPTIQLNIIQCIIYCIIVYMGEISPFF